MSLFTLPGIYAPIYAPIAREYTVSAYYRYTASSVRPLPRLIAITPRGRVPRPLRSQLLSALERIEAQFAVPRA